jgi:hypothetical protein
MTPSDLEIVKQQYEQLKKVCERLELDVRFIDMPLTKQKKESLKAIIHPEPKKTWWGFAI